MNHINPFYHIKCISISAFLITMDPIFFIFGISEYWAVSSINIHCCLKMANISSSRKKMVSLRKPWYLYHWVRDFSKKGKLQFTLFPQSWLYWGQKMIIIFSLDPLMSPSMPLIKYTLISVLFIITRLQKFI